MCVCVWKFLIFICAFSARIYSSYMHTYMHETHDVHKQARRYVRKYRHTRLVDICRHACSHQSTCRHAQCGAHPRCTYTMHLACLHMYVRTEEQAVLLLQDSVRPLRCRQQRDHLRSPLKSVDLLQLAAHLVCRDSTHAHMFWSKSPLHP